MVKKLKILGLSINLVTSMDNMVGVLMPQLPE